MSMHLDIPGLQQQFEQHGFPYWRVYQGTQKIGQFNNDEIDYEGEELLTYSWMQLEEFLSSFPKGRVKVQIRKNVSDQKDRAIVLPVQWGYDGYPANGVSGQQSPAMFGGQNLMMQMLVMQQKHFEQMAEKDRMLLEERYRRERLEEDLEHAEAPSIGMTMAQEGIGVLKEYLRAQTFRPKPVAQASLGTLGQEPKEQKQRSVSFDQIMVDVNAVAKVMPEYHPNYIFRALSIFAQQNPEQAKAFLGPMIEQLQAHEQGGNTDSE